MAENQKNDVATTVADEIAGAEVIQFGKRDFNTYNRLISNIDRGFSKASEAYIAIGCSLWADSPQRILSHRQLQVYC